MTPASDTRTPQAVKITRRDLRAITPAGSPQPRLSRPRRVLSAFAGLAAFGFLAAYLVPTTAALAENAAPSRYDTVQADAQGYVAAANIVPAGSMSYGSSYAVELQPQANGAPHPKASVEEWREYAASQDVSVPDGATRDEVIQLIDDAAAKAAEEAAKADPVVASAAAGTAAAPAPFYTGGGAPEQWMAAAGIAQGDWGYVDYIVTRESGWNPNATNPSSGACGLVQALPCSKVPGGGYDPVANLSWANSYAVGRYGSWGAAYAFWTANHWW